MTQLIEAKNITPEQEAREVANVLRKAREQADARAEALGRQDVNDFITSLVVDDPDITWGVVMDELNAEFCR